MPNPDAIHPRIPLERVIAETPPDDAHQRAGDAALAELDRIAGLRTAAQQS